MTHGFRLKWFITIVVLAAAAAQAEVIISTVPVGNEGNAADSTGYGAVDYAYNIGTYEVTAGQYTEFLNAVAATDTYELYDAGMYNSDNNYRCNIRQLGSSGSYSYSVASNWAKRPVNSVSWGDAARFANWLHNGQLTGPQDANTTEDGAYYLNGATSDAALLAVSREANWQWAIPTEDEWYKAAYHKNDGVTGNYYDYPTSNDAAPSNDRIWPDDPGNNATFYDGSDFTIGSPYYRTNVGIHGNSDSPYGTFDQGGNVWEWNEAVVFEFYRGWRGGSFYIGSDTLLASYRSSLNPGVGHTGAGFRVASSAAVPEPGSITLLVSGLLACLIWWRRRK